VPNVTVNFSEVKVKLQGQNRRTENLPLVTVRPWFLDIFTKFDNSTKVISARNMTSDNIQDGGLVGDCAP